MSDAFVGSIYACQGVISSFNLLICENLISLLFLVVMLFTKFTLVHLGV